MTTSYIGSSLITQKLTELETALSVANTAISDSNLSIAAANNKVSALESWSSDRVKYVYPNGGAKGNEKGLLISSTYIVPSPFPSGTFFTTYSEYYSDELSEWIHFEAMIYSVGFGGYGVKSFPRIELDQVLLCTGSASLGTHGRHGGTWEEATNSTFTNDTKWRVRCVKEN